MVTRACWSRISVSVATINSISSSRSPGEQSSVRMGQSPAARLHAVSSLTPSHPSSHDRPCRGSTPPLLESFGDQIICGERAGPSGIHGAESRGTEGHADVADGYGCGRRAPGSAGALRVRVRLSNTSGARRQNLHQRQRRVGGTSSAVGPGSSNHCGSGNGRASGGGRAKGVSSESSREGTSRSRSRSRGRGANGR